VGEGREQDLAEEGKGGGFAKGDTVLRYGDEEFAEDVVDVGGGEEIAVGEAEISPPSRWDSRSCSCCLAWKAQKKEWAGLRNIRQQRPSEK
jgi:hypothetical protein